MKERRGKLINSDHIYVFSSVELLKQMVFLLIYDNFLILNLKRITQ